MFFRLRIFFSLGAVALLCGCNTLGSLGLPTGTSPNKMLPSAKCIANRPSQSLLVPKELANEPQAVYHVGIGDSILVETVNFDASIRLPGDQVVRPDGTISLGQFGKLSVVNKTVEQIQSEAQSSINRYLENELQREFESEQQRQRLEQTEGDSALQLPVEESATKEQQVLLARRIADVLKKNQVSARLVNWESKKIYVLGEVNSPGAFQYNGHQNVLDGIIEAGGLTSKANHHEIIVARPTTCDSCRIVMKVCYDQIVQLGDSSTNYQLQPGDRVFIPALTFLDDLSQTLSGGRNANCPRCQNCPQSCDLPEGCE